MIGGSVFNGRGGSVFNGYLHHPVQLFPTILGTFPSNLYLAVHFEIPRISLYKKYGELFLLKGCKPLYVMNLFIYRPGIFFYKLSIYIAQFFSAKAKIFLLGRKENLSSLQNFRRKYPTAKVLWVHCASLGEFEQSRPLIEKIKEKHPDFAVALTFFSPSGYEMRKNYKGADWVGYIPIDTRREAQAFISLLNPSLVIFVKNEFWVEHLLFLQQKNIPLYLIAAVFRADQHFFKWNGGVFQKVLLSFDKIFVQDETSLELLQKIGYNRASVAGDPRIDSVLQRIVTNKGIPLVEQFIQGQPTLVVGSSWMKDINILQSGINHLIEKGWKIIMAPHDIKEKNLENHEAAFPEKSIRFSGLTAQSRHLPILIIDNIGMLSGLYQYGTIAYIGGGFGEGIHSTLEPAAYELPIIFGPRYQKFIEARYFVKHKGAFSVDTEVACHQAIEHLIHKKNREDSAQIIRDFMDKNRGSTDLIYESLNIATP